MTHTHTPGPWFVSFPADGLSTRHPVISCNGETTSSAAWDGTPAVNVARAEWRGNVADTNANAQLIASAPDLIIALRRALSALEGVSYADRSIDKACEIARTAIARATRGAQ